jgi:carboxypeptidase C (cathepsin A)
MPRRLLASILVLLAGAAFAQEAPRRGQGSSPAQAASQPAQAQPERQRRLPADSVTRHQIAVGGRTLAFTAKAGVLVLQDGQGRPEIEMAFVAYTLDGADRRTRPVAFAMNGGPGSASAWLHIGVMGPWRLSIEGAAARPSAPPDLVPNAETWLDATDLVFVDPAGTGFSRLLTTEADARSRIWSVDGDIESIATFVRRWLIQEDRLASPKLFVGESYAGLRGPKLAHALQTRHGVGLSALVLVSPILDYGWRAAANWQPLGLASLLPSMTATVREARGAVTREALDDVETYARTEFVTDLLRGRQDRAAVARIVERVAGFTGLDRALVARLGGRVDRGVFLRERTRADGVVGSAYDATVTGIDPYPDSFAGRFSDPFTTALSAPVTSAMLALYGERLNWKPQSRYLLLSTDVNRAWQWTRGRPAEAMGDLAKALALDPDLEVLVAHGLADLVTPYFESRLLLDQLPPYATAERVRLVTYGGGHMFYSREASRAQFRRDAGALIERITRRGN